MRIALAGPDFEENLSIRYLSSALMADGHETVLLPFNSADDAAAVLDAARGADIVGLSLCFQSRALEFLELARGLKAQEPEQLVVAGGHYASCAAEDLLTHHPELDLIVIHEGEQTLVEIADAMPALRERLPRIAGVAYRDDGQVRFTPARHSLDDLDELYDPDRRGPVHVIAGVPTSYLMGSRGCYGSCAYCCITTLHRIAPGRRFRQRSVERIADEMATLYHERGTRQFVFHDDNFLVPAEAKNHERIAALEHALQERGVRDIALVIKCRPADANRAVLQRLKDLGLVRLFLGVESATESGLADLERRQTVADSERALETCAELDLSAQFTLMTFHPDATLATIRDDVGFMRRFAGNPLNFCRTEIYAGTPLEQRMITVGRARGNYLARVYDLADPAADLACQLSLELFHTRCWSGGSLMQAAIGLDHTAAVAQRFYAGRQAEALTDRVHRWVRAANLDTIGLLEEVVELAASRAGRSDGEFARSVLRIAEREAATRPNLLAEATGLKLELEGLRPGRSRPRESVRRWARQVAAAALVLGMPAAPALPAVAQEAQVPRPPAKTNPDEVGTFLGVVHDSQGAVIRNVAVTIINKATNVEKKYKTNRKGEYIAKNLPTGHYRFTFAAEGFQTLAMMDVELKKGEQHRVDATMSITNFGCCEYAAVPLEPQPTTLPPDRNPKRPPAPQPPK